MGLKSVFQTFLSSSKDLITQIVAESFPGLIGRMHTVRLEKDLIDRIQLFAHSYCVGDNNCLLVLGGVVPLAASTNM